MLFKPLAAAVLLGGVGLASADQQNRFYLVDHSDFGAKLGYYLDFENSAPTGSVCHLATLKLIFGFADGHNWKFLTTNPSWKLGGTYVAEATLTGSSSSLKLNGIQQVKDTGLALSAVDKPTTAAVEPGWASDPADYYIKEISVAVSLGASTGKANVQNPAAPQLALFQPERPTPVPISGHFSGGNLHIQARFVVEPYQTDLHTLAPMVDRYGESRYGDWPGKVHNDADLVKAAKLETETFQRWGVPRDYDPYGGYKGAWHLAPTGFYKLARHSGKWWLVTPAGNPVFYTGLCTAPAVAWDKTPVTGREYLFAQLPPRDVAGAWDRGVWDGDATNEYAALHSMNLIRKFGKSKWQTSGANEALTRIKYLGFSGLGKWCDPNGKTPVVVVLQHAAVPNLARHPDIFDPAIQQQVRDVLANQIRPHLGDPTILGWSVGSEYDEIIDTEEIKQILTKHPNSPAAIQLSRRVPSGEIESMRREFASAYYKFIYATVKSIDPNHLCIGPWIVPGWWVNDEDWRLMAANCDVVGLDRYADQFTDFSLYRLMSEAGKPVLCGEFSFPEFYGGNRGFGFFDQASSDTSADAGVKYARYLHEAATNPYCVGAMWFQYRDEPITGRGPGKDGRLVDGEHYAFGVVDVTDRIKWDLAKAMRQANLDTVHWRLGR